MEGARAGIRGRLQGHSGLNGTETVSAVCTIGLEIWVERSDNWEFL